MTLDIWHILRFEQCQHFEKGSYANRYYLAGPNGVMLLSVPVEHLHRDRTPLRDLRICNRDRWQVLHWRTLGSAYRRSPWFEFYEDDLRPLYEKKFEYLMDWNLEAFRLVSQWLGRSWELSRTDSYETDYAGGQITDARRWFNPKGRKEPRPGAPVYQQVFESRTGFLAGLSILDLIFCEGRRALHVLRNDRQGAGETR